MSRVPRSIGRVARAALATLGCLATAGALNAQAAERFTEEVHGAEAVIQIAGSDDAAAGKAAALRILAADEYADGDTGAAIDRALGAMAEAGAGAGYVRWRGTLAVSGPPPGAPGWMVPVGFGTPGHPLLQMPLANIAFGTAVNGELKVGVLARGAEIAQTLATEAARLGRNEGRKLVTDTQGARLVMEDARFAPLFDGRSLKGWTPVGGRYDGQAIWAAERGAIVGKTGPNGEGGLLYTEEMYSSFVIEMDVDIEEPFDSGIFVHMLPRETGLKGAQVTLDNREGGEIAAIYADGFLEHHPEVKEHYRQGEWNHFEVRVTGFEFRIEVWMNGDKVCDYQLPPNTPGFASRGRIGVQVHGGNPGEKRAKFKNVRIRELPLFSDESAREGDPWMPLFDGTSLDGWELHGVEGAVRAEDGELIVSAGAEGQLMTAEDYEDFRLRLDFQIARMANSGLFLRATRDGANAAYSGCEVQILDDFNWEAETNSTLKDWQLTGSLYGAVAAGDKRYNAIGEWNTYEVLYRGSRLAVALNGQVLYDVDTHALEPFQGPPFAERAKAGFIGLQAHAPSDLKGDLLRFRNLRIQRL